MLAVSQVNEEEKWKTHRFLVAQSHMVDWNILNPDRHYPNIVAPIQSFHHLHTPEFYNPECAETRTICGQTVCVQKQKQKKNKL